MLDFFPSGLNMFSSNTCYSVIAIILLLSNLSLPSANRQSSMENTALLLAGKPSSDPATPLQNSAVKTASVCEGSSVPILPPSFTLPSSYLWSRRAMMFLQMLPDGKINGTFALGPYAKLNMEIVGPCMVRIQGVVSQRYLVMEPNGTLVSKTQPDQEKSVFTYQLQKDFYTFKNGKHFIAFKHGGRLKREKGDGNGRNVKKSTRFVLINRRSRRRRYPSGVDPGQMGTSRDSRNRFGADPLQPNGQRR